MKITLPKLAIPFFFSLFAITVQAQTADTSSAATGKAANEFMRTDTVIRKHHPIGEFILPAALIGYGALSFEIKPIRHFDFYLHDKIVQSAPNFHTSAESYFLFTPIVMVYGLNAFGIKGKDDFFDRSAILGISAGIVGVTELSVKHLSHRLRPNGADYQSFPSGHTGAAFMAAEFLAEEYGDKSPVYTITGYTIAAATGVFRMYNRDHWFSDVVAGAGFGILSVRAASLVYPYLKKHLLHRDKSGRSTMIMPTYQDGVPGLSFAMQL